MKTIVICSNFNKIMTSVDEKQNINKTEINYPAITIYGKTTCSPT